MSVPYKITNVERLNNEVVQITWEHTPFDTAITEKANFWVTDTTDYIKQFISDRLTALPTVSTTPPASPDQQLIAIVAMKGQNYVSTTH